MKSFFYLFVILLFTGKGFAQNFDKIDEQARAYPLFREASSLAKQIKKDFSTDTEKTRALFVWLTKNISYDLNEFYRGKKQYSFRYASQKELENLIKKRNDELVHKTLKTRKAVCEGYAQTFQSVCHLLAIECEVISGFTKTSASEIGELPLGGRHAWNAVKINKQWQLIDATWGAGFSENNKWIRKFDGHFFFTAPKQLLNSHYPINSNWQLIPNPIHEKEFADKPIYSPSFYNSCISLKSPLAGLISTKNKKFITVQFKNMAPDCELGYAYEKDYYLTTIIPEVNQNGTSIKIPCQGKRNTTLHIIANGETVLHYKIR
ncbi:transglutaminase domain-containing protein [Flavicella sediminum]|uniref:transglutaminase domain-containing protein n=1 Tax=Flavicella sediminum TaxID=2585141 RepID=UPI001121A9DA|nr:transglutaminase domain-containing protein [Flavicella sediminum]